MDNANHTDSSDLFKTSHSVNVPKNFKMFYTTNWNKTGTCHIFTPLYVVKNSCLWKFAINSSGRDFNLKFFLNYTATHLNRGFCAYEAILLLGLDELYAKEVLLSKGAFSHL